MIHMVREMNRPDGDILFIANGIIWVLHTTYLNNNSKSKPQVYTANRIYVIQLIRGNPKINEGVTMDKNIWKEKKKLVKLVIIVIISVIVFIVLFQFVVVCNKKAQPMPDEHNNIMQANTDIPEETETISEFVSNETDIKADTSGGDFIRIRAVQENSGIFTNSYVILNDMELKRD